MADPIDISKEFALHSNVSESDAFHEFRSLHFSSFLWGLKNGPLRRIALAYLPFALYRLRYEMGSAHCARYFAMDLVEGALDLYEFPDAIRPCDLCTIQSRNKIMPTLSANQAESVLREKALRLIFQQGFFRLRHPQLRIECILDKFHVPYWLGFYGNDDTLRCRALDAVRRRMDGQKTVQLFERWLAQ